MLDKAEMYNFWSVFSRKVIGKRIEWIIRLEVFAAYFVPSIRAEPHFREHLCITYAYINGVFVQFNRAGDLL